MQDEKIIIHFLLSYQEYRQSVISAGTALLEVKASGVQRRKDKCMEINQNRTKADFLSGKQQTSSAVKDKWQPTYIRRTLEDLCRLTQ